MLTIDIGETGASLERLVGPQALQLEYGAVTQRHVWRWAERKVAFVSVLAGEIRDVPAISRRRVCYGLGKLVGRDVGERRRVVTAVVLRICHISSAVQVKDNRVVDSLAA